MGASFKNLDEGIEKCRESIKESLENLKGARALLDINVVYSDKDLYEAAREDEMEAFSEILESLMELMKYQADYSGAYYGNSHR